jgi:shikimate dehydrogenase
MTDKYAVIGNPIAHSKSPLIHAAFANQTQQAMCYEAILAPLDGFAATVQTLIEQGYKGVNVTVPFKFAAFALANQHSDRATAAGAANTLTFNAQGIVADNTDGAGIVRDIEHNLQHRIAGKRVLLIGAGGAAEGVLQPLLAAQPSTLVISNRSVDKAQRMVKKIADLSSHTLTHVKASSFEALQGQSFDIVINATSTGLSDNALAIPNSIFAKNCLAYDMMYGRETPFMQQAKDNGAEVSDGLGMLVEQAAEAFTLWRGIRPETQAVMQGIRKL